MKTTNLMSALCVLLLSLCVFTIQAQNHTFDNIMTVKVRNTGTIHSDNGIKGYYAFYQLDKSKGSDYNYTLSIMNENLDILSSKSLTANKNAAIREVVYNDVNIMVKIHDPKAKTYEYRMYDKNAELVKTQSYPVGYQFEYGPNLKEEQESELLFSVEGKGFVNYATKTKKKAVSSQALYDVQYFSSDGKTTWVYNSDPTSESYEYASFLGESNDILLSLVTKRDRLMSKDLEEYVLGLDLKTGKKLFENKVEDNKFSCSTTNINFDPATNNFILYGLFFEKDAKTARAKSLGLSAFVMNSKGEIVSRKYNTWAGDIGKFLPANDRGKIEDVGYLYFHKFIKTANGKTYGIAEQYRKAASAGGIALNVASGLLGGGPGASNIEIKTGDMYILEFDKDYGISNVKVFDKTKSSVLLPAGLGMASIRILGTYLKATREFDYLFMQPSADKSEFTVGYMDYERGGKDVKGWTFGSINYLDGVFKVDKIKMNSKAKLFNVYPAKTGYVMIYEYFKKEKKLDLRLEKLNY